MFRKIPAGYVAAFFLHDPEAPGWYLNPDFLGKPRPNPAELAELEARVAALRKAHEAAKAECACLVEF